VLSLNRKLFIECCSEISINLVFRSQCYFVSHFLLHCICFYIINFYFLCYISSYVACAFVICLIKYLLTYLLTFMGSMPVGEERMVNHLTPFRPVCCIHAECVSHCYNILPHHLLIFFLVSLFCLTPPLFQSSPPGCFSILLYGILHIYDRIDSTSFS